MGTVVFITPRYVKGGRAPGTPSGIPISPCGP